MKKIFFYSNHREDDEAIGITKKVHSEIEAMRELGFVVYYSCYYHNGIGIFDNDNKLLYHKRYIFHKKSINHYSRRFENIMVSKKYLENNYFDILYMRFHFWDLCTLDFVKTAKARNLKVVVEAHAYPYYIKETSKLMQFVFKMDGYFQKFVHSYVDLVAAITDKNAQIWNCDTIRIENGINVKDSKCRTPISYKSQTLKLVCVANENISHGIDRLIKGIAAYYSEGGKNDVLVWLIGEYFAETKELVKRYKLTKHVIFIGKKSGDELFEYYNRADFGVGPLAAFRQDYHSGICLKTKEYFAAGLPFITSACQTAEINKFYFAVVYDETNDPIDISSLFIKKETLKDKDVIAEEMHEYAMKNYSWVDEMRKVFVYLGYLV